MKRLTYTLSTLLLSFAISVANIGPASAAVEGRGRTHERVDAREKAIEFETRNKDPNSLSKELQKSELYRTETRSDKESEQGHTLRRHVPDRPTREAINQHVEARDAWIMKNSKTEANKPDLSMYSDVNTAERAIDRTIKRPENQTRIKEWTDSGQKGTLALYGEHKSDVGIHFDRSADQKGPVDMSSGKSVNNNVVVLAKDGKGGYFVRTSYPVTEAQVKKGISVDGN